MRERTRFIFAILLLAALGLTGLMALADGAAPAATLSPAGTLSRGNEPVIVYGAAVLGLNNRPVSQVFVYAYKDNAWKQIPFQVDEVTAAGRYASLEDGLLDLNDQVLFMASDLGSRPPAGQSLSQTLPISHIWYELEVTDPLSPSQQGWAYLVHSPVLATTFITDYVNFNPSNHRLAGVNYRLGFATPNPWVDYIALGSSPLDMLDRSKSRLFCTTPIICPVTEEVSVSVPDDLIKDGPVRVIVRNGRVLGYGSRVSWTTGVTIPTNLYGDVRFSLDFAPAASGSILYNSVVTSGVTIDGSADNVPTQPVSAWLQLSTLYGTMIQVADLGQINGSLSNYYEDDSTFKPLVDTGDKYRYGETGIRIKNPDFFILYQFDLYFLAGSQPNRGAEFEAYTRQPLQVTTTRFVAGPLSFLPFVTRR